MLLNQTTQMTVHVSRRLKMEHVQQDGLETSIGVPERYHAYIHTKSTAVVFTEEDL
jgi:hypothetical protein